MLNPPSTPPSPPHPPPFWLVDSDTICCPLPCMLCAESVQSSSSSVWTVCWILIPKPLTCAAWMTSWPPRRGSPYMCLSFSGRLRRLSLTKKKQMERLKRSRPGAEEGFRPVASPTDSTVIAACWLDEKTRVASVLAESGFLSCRACLRRRPQTSLPCLSCVLWSI